MNAPATVQQLAPPGQDTLSLLVTTIHLQAQGIHSFELRHPDGDELPPVTAGAHVDVHLPGAIVRSYSLAGDPADRQRWVLGVLREKGGRGGSRAMHEKVRVGERLTVGWPRNAFALVDEAAHTVLIAGGIGITPIKAMAHALKAQGASFELHYCCRSPQNAAFTEELKALVPECRLHWHFDGGDPARGLDLASLLREPAPGSHLYYCGPSGFMDACAQASSHWPAGTVHCEHFKAPAAAAAASATGAFEVHLARKDITLQVEPGQSIVSAIELAGLRVPTSCLSGLCGACKVDYLEGEVEHNDYILNDDEKTHCMTLCVSRAKSQRLVLDI